VRVRACEHERQVELGTAQQSDRLIVSAAPECNRRLRCPREQLPHDRRDEADECGREPAQRDRDRGPAREFRQLGVQAPEARADLLCVLDDEPAGGGQMNSLSATDDERHAGLPLEQRNLPRDRRLGVAERLCRRRERAARRYLPQRLHEAQIYHALILEQP
jgi:hypothetical protein